MAARYARTVTDRVQGCCRDHSLFCVGALRSHGIPARTRVGSAGYFIDGWHHDHVIVETWFDDRWVRFDSEVDTPRRSLPRPTDIDRSPLTTTGFVTAAEAWVGYRHGTIDADTYGVGPEVPGFRGPFFLFDEVIFEVAHRFGDELSLWDGWGRVGEPDRTIEEPDAAWLDEIVDLLIASDEGDLDAEHTLRQRYRSDDGLHPGPTVLQASPYGDEPIKIGLQRNLTRTTGSVAGGRGRGGPALSRVGIGYRRGARSVRPAREVRMHGASAVGVEGEPSSRSRGAREPSIGRVGKQ